jgi:hypothetical protein
MKTTERKVVEGFFYLKSDTDGSDFATSGMDTWMVPMQMDCEMDTMNYADFPCFVSLDLRCGHEKSDGLQFTSAVFQTRSATEPPSRPVYQTPPPLSKSFHPRTVEAYPHCLGDRRDTRGLLFRYESQAAG